MSTAEAAPAEVVVVAGTTRSTGATGPPESGTIAPGVTQMQRTIGLLTALFAFTACRADIRAADYDQTCDVDADCVAIEEGDACFECGAVTAAVNAAEADRVAADRNARASQCLPWENVEVDCFCTNVAVVGCVSNQCELVESPCEIPPEPPTFLVASPNLSAPIPTNALIRGQRFGGTADGPVTARLEVVDDAGVVTSRPLGVATDHCAMINGCELRIDTAPLNPGTGQTLVVTVDGEDSRFPLTVGDAADTTPPVLTGFDVEAEGVASTSIDNGPQIFQTTVQFTTPTVTDDGDLAGIALARRIDGSALVLVERQGSADVILVDGVAEGVGTEACYSVIAWDSAGNEATTPERCVDIVIDDDEKPLGCSAPGAGQAPIVALWSGLALRFRRRRR